MMDYNEALRLLLIDEKENNLTDKECHQYWDIVATEIYKRTDGDSVDLYNSAAWPEHWWPDTFENETIDTLCMEWLRMCNRDREEHYVNKYKQRYMSESSE